MISPLEPIGGGTDDGDAAGVEEIVHLYSLPKNCFNFLGEIYAIRPNESIKFSCFRLTIETLDDFIQCDEDR